MQSITSCAWCAFAWRQAVDVTLRRHNLETISDQTFLDWIGHGSELVEFKKSFGGHAIHNLMWMTCLCITAYSWFHFAWTQHRNDLRSNIPSNQKWIAMNKAGQDQMDKHTTFTWTGRENKVPHPVTAITARPGEPSELVLCVQSHACSAFSHASADTSTNRFVHVLYVCRWKHQQ